MNNEFSLNLYEQIPEAYRERYDIRLKTSPEDVKFFTRYIHINEANISIIPDGKETISISEAEDKLTIKIAKAAEIYMYKQFTLIGTIL